MILPGYTAGRFVARYALEEPIKEDVTLGSAKILLGVIDTTGFTTFQILETEGTIGDTEEAWGEPMACSGVLPVQSV